MSDFVVCFEFKHFVNDAWKFNIILITVYDFLFCFISKYIAISFAAFCINQSSICPFFYILPLCAQFLEVSVVLFRYISLNQNVNAEYNVGRCFSTMLQSPICACIKRLDGKWRSQKNEIVAVASSPNIWNMTSPIDKVGRME